MQVFVFTNKNWLLRPVLQRYDVVWMVTKLCKRRFDLFNCQVLMLGDIGIIENLLKAQVFSFVLKRKGWVMTHPKGFKEKDF
ncbi:hypothetical protein D3C84_987690 [compost metagenome]